jgi:2-polyprenyl-3-methyl-5-hydroxy-6-metoxy-1,4-benzoquinol methylase
MRRSLTPEIMDDPNIPHESWERFHRQLGSLHRFLGNQRAILDALRRHPRPIGRVLDIGCGSGELLSTIQRDLRVKVQGIDLRPPHRHVFDVPIVAADAARDRLPDADVAVCVTVFHHLTEAEITALVRNAGRSVERLIVLDLVRHWLPLALFTMLVAPFVMRTVALDGCQSIRRAFTPRELRAIVQRALAGTRASWVHSVTPFRSRQIIDITWS